MIIKRSTPLSLATMVLLSTVSSLAFANPQDGVVAAGAAVISSSGPAMNIHQSTDRAVIDWRSFDIGANESTTFHQPAATSITVNRVNAASPSQIQGALKANGNLVLINPNGVVFDRGSQVDVNGLVATTSDIDNQQFMSGGPLVLSKPGNPNATVANHGTITAKDAGLVGLVAPNVVNSGVINARLGRAELASGDSATLDFYGDGLLEIKASDALQSQLIENTGRINAAGGVITLTAAAGREQVNSVIKVDGELNAPGIGTKEGKIIIFAEGSHAVKPGDTPDVKTGRSTVLITGKLNVSNATGKGGTVTVAADQIAIMSGAKIDATGRDGGGRVTVGGDGHVPNISTDFIQPVMVVGAAPVQAPTPKSLFTILQSDTLIDVSATGNGHGGQVSVWADDRTEFNGRIDADGEGSGDGGFVETSGRVALLSYGQVSAATRRGRKGTWLLDPADIEITAATNSNNTGVPNFTATGDTSQVSAASIVAQLNGGTDVIIMTTNDGHAGNGDIFVNSAINVTTGSGSLTLSAYRDVSVTRAITLQGGNLVIRSNNAGAADGSTGNGSISISNTGHITTNGGNITIGGGNGTITGSVVNAIGEVTTAATGFAKGNAQNQYGVFTSGAQINAGGGNIVINGIGDARVANSNHGVRINAGSVRTNGNGTIRITGIGGGSGESAINYGVVIQTSATVSTERGALVVVGIGGGVGTTAGGNTGVVAGSSATIQSTDTGNVYINGLGGGGTYGDNRGVSSSSVGGFQTTGSGDLIIYGRGGTGSSVADVGVTSSLGGGYQTTGTGNLIIRGFAGDTGQAISVPVQQGFRTTGGGDLIVSGATISVANGGFSTTGSTADMTIYANAMTITGTTVVTAGGIMTLAAFNTAYGVSLGTSVANTLNIGDTDFAKLTAGSYVFGSTTNIDGATNTGNVSINTTHDFGAANVSFIAGNDILLNGSLFQTSAAPVNYLMRAARHIAYAAGMGMFSLGGGFNLELDSDSDTNGVGTINFNGSTVINAATGSIVVRDAMIIAGTFSMASNGITLHGTVDGDAVGTRSASFDAKTGTFTNLAAIGSIRQLANLTLTGDTMAIGADLHGVGSLSILPRSSNRLMRINDGADDGTAMHINNTELGYIQTDWSQVNFGILSGATAYLDVGAVTFNNNVNLRGWRTRLYGALEMLGFNNISFQPQDVELHAGSSLTTNGGNVSVTPGISIHAANRTITTNGGYVLIGGSLTSQIAALGTFTIDTDNGAIVIGNNTTAITAGAMTTGSYVLDAGFSSVDLNGTVNMPGNLTITGSSFTSGDMGGSTALNAVSISTVGAMTLPSINATSIFARNTGATADITIASGKTLTATGSGNALVLAAGRNFINLSNSSALSAVSGRWLVYSADPANNTRGGLLPNASNFNMTYAGNPPAGIGSGNRFIYSRATAPTVTLVTDADTVIYGNSYGVGALSYQYGSGLVGGDSWGSIGLTGSAGLTTTYVAGTTDAGAHVGMINGTVGTLSSVLGYSFAFTAGDLNVSQRSLTVNTANASKYLSQSDPAFSGSDNLLAGDAAQIIWGYAPVGYGGGVGSYTIEAVATDPFGRLNNYVRVDNYGSFTVLADIVVTPPQPPQPPVSNDVPDTVLRGFAVPILPLLNPVTNIPAATRSAAASDDAQESDDAKAEYRADGQNDLLGGWELYRIGPRLQAILDI